MFVDAHLYSCRPQISVCQRVTYHIYEIETQMLIAVQVSTKLKVEL